MIEGNTTKSNIKMYIGLKGIGDYPKFLRFRPIIGLTKFRLPRIVLNFDFVKMYAFVDYY